MFPHASPVGLAVVGAWKANISPRRGVIRRTSIVSRLPLCRVGSMPGLGTV